MSMIYQIRPKSDVSIHMFADDTTIYYTGKEVEETIDASNHILNHFRVWYCKNHLTVHTGKAVAMLISNYAFVGPLRHLAPVVQTLDSAIHWINDYPLDNSIGFSSVYPLDSDLSARQRYPSFEQLGPDVRKFLHSLHY